MRAELLHSTDQRWTDMLARCDHDVYHRPEWARASEEIDGGIAGAVFVSNGSNVLLVPFIQRALGDELWDAISPYGYAGPVTDAPAGDPFQSTAMQIATEAMASRGGVSWFVRLHPLIDAGAAPADSQLVNAGRTVSVDLRQPVEVMWGQTRSGHRSDINRARRSGVISEWSTSDNDYAAFVHLYGLTMGRVGASDYYFFGPEYFAKLRTELGAELGLRVARLDGEVIGGALFTIDRGNRYLGYHLSAADPDQRNRQPAKVVLDDVRRWGHEHGFARLHLGGGVGGHDDPLFRFKQGFSPDEHPYRVLKVVLDRTRYDALCASAGVPNDAEAGGFFPGYRAF